MKIKLRGAEGERLTDFQLLLLAYILKNAGKERKVSFSVEEMRNDLKLPETFSLQSLVNELRKLVEVQVHKQVYTDDTKVASCFSKMENLMGMITFELAEIWSDNTLTFTEMEIISIAFLIVSDILPNYLNLERF